jgi:hypothetical protein
MIDEEKYATTRNIASILRGEENGNSSRQEIRSCRWHGWKVTRTANVEDTQIHGDEVAMGIVGVVSGKTTETAREKPIRHPSRYKKIMGL